MTIKYFKIYRVATPLHEAISRWIFSCNEFLTGFFHFTGFEITILLHNSLRDVFLQCNALQDFNSFPKIGFWGVLRVAVGKNFMRFVLYDLLKID